MHVSLCTALKNHFSFSELQSYVIFELKSKYVSAILIPLQAISCTPEGMRTTI